MAQNLEEYAKLSENQKSKLKKDELKRIVDNQINSNRSLPLSLGTDSIRDIITEVVSNAIEKILAIKIKELLTDLTTIVKTETEAISKDLTTLREDLDSNVDDIKSLKNVVYEQQKYLESLKREKLRNNVFISGIPNSVTINDVVTDENNVIINHILTFLVPGITEEVYKVDKVFEPKEGFTRHSAILSFTRYDKKIELLGKCKDLKNRTDVNHWLRKVFLRSEQTPLTSKENTRLFKKFKSLRDQHVDNGDIIIKLEKGKLLQNGVLIDEFNLANQIF